MKTLRVGIASYAEMKARTLAIARGEIKKGPSEPTVWFSSAESFARVLSARNRGLLQVIADSAPASLAELAQLTGRAKSNLSRTLKTLERYGLVTLTRGARGRLVAEVPFSAVTLAVPLTLRVRTKRAVA